ncbi:MAG: endonuclease/exonuclease/phosphatase family protein [Polyangiales bacterium]
MRHVFLLTVCVSLLSACAESTPKGPKAFELTVGTYNLRNKEDWWEDRFPLIADGMVELRADILGLQEVSEREMQLETLSALLEERDPSLDYNVLFTLAAEPFGTLTGEGLASMAQFPIEDMGTLFLSEGRSATWTRVSLGNDRYLDHFNTHLHAIRSAPDVRAVQAASIVEYINEHDEGWPIVLTGDFNATDDEQAIATVVDAGFVDTFRAVHGDETDEIGATSPIKLRPRTGGPRGHPPNRLCLPAGGRYGYKRGDCRSSGPSWNREATGSIPPITSACCPRSIPNSRSRPTFRVCTCVRRRTLW